MELADLIVYWRIVRKRWWLIVLLIVTTVITMVGVSFTRPPQYQTSVRFQVTAIPAVDVTLYQTARGGGYREEIAATRASFIDTLTSLEVAWETVGALELSMTGRELADRISVEESTNSGFARLIVTAEDPQLAADFANKLIEVGRQRYGELNAYPLTLSRQFISAQLEQTQQELGQAQAELILFKTENNIGTLDSSLAARQTLIRSLELARDEALALGEQQRANNYATIITERQAELQDLIQLSAQYAALDSRVSQLQSTYNFLLEKETEARLKENEALNLGFIQVLGPARVPNSPEPRISISLLALGSVVAAVVGVMIAFLWEYLEKRRWLQAGSPGGENVQELANIRQ